MKRKDIHGLYSYYGAISSYGDQQSLVIWSLLNVNHDYTLVNDLYCSVLCDPRTHPRSHTDSVIDCLDHGEEGTELPPMDCDCNVLQLHFTWLQTNVVKTCLSYALPCILMNAASVNTLVESFNIPSHKPKQMSVRPYEEQPKSMMLVYQSLPLITQDGRLTSDPHASLSIITHFAESADTSAHHATVGNHDPVSNMSAATWEPAAVQVYEESNDFSITLTLDMNGVSKIGLDIIGADLWSLHWLLREKHVLSLLLQTKSHFWSMKICAQWCLQGISRSCLHCWFPWECLSNYDCRRPQEVTMMATCLILTATLTVSTFQLRMNALCLRSQFPNTNLLRIAFHGPNFTLQKSPLSKLKGELCDLCQLHRSSVVWSGTESQILSFIPINGLMLSLSGMILVMVANLVRYLLFIWSYNALVVVGLKKGCSKSSEMVVISSISVLFSIWGSVWWFYVTLVQVLHIYISMCLCDCQNPNLCQCHTVPNLIWMVVKWQEWSKWCHMHVQVQVHVQTHSLSTSSERGNINADSNSKPNVKAHANDMHSGNKINAMIMSHSEG